MSGVRCRGSHWKTGLPVTFRKEPAVCQRGVLLRTWLWPQPKTPRSFIPSVGSVMPSFLGDSLVFHVLRRPGNPIY